MASRIGGFGPGELPEPLGQGAAVVGSHPVVAAGDVFRDRAPPHPLDLAAHVGGGHGPSPEVVGERAETGLAEGVESRPFLGEHVEERRLRRERGHPLPQVLEVERDEPLGRAVVGGARQPVVEPAQVVDEGGVRLAGAVELDGDLGAAAGPGELTPGVALLVRRGQRVVQALRGTTGTEQPAGLPPQPPPVHPRQLDARRPALGRGRGRGDEVAERDVEDLGGEHLEGVADVADGAEHAAPVQDRGVAGQLDAAEHLGVGGTGLVDPAAGEPLDPLPRLGDVGRVRQPGTEPRVAGAVAGPPAQLREPRQGTDGARERHRVEALQRLPAQAHPGARRGLGGRERRHRLLHLVQRHPPRWPGLVEGGGLLVEVGHGFGPVHGGATRAAGVRERLHREPVEPLHELTDDAAPLVPAAADVEDEVTQPDGRQPPGDGLDGRAPRRDEQYPLTVGRQRGDEVGDGLGLPGAGSTPDDEVGAGPHLFDDGPLAGVGLDDQPLLGLRVAGGGRRRGGHGVTRQGGDEVVAGEDGAGRTEVGDERGLEVRERTDDDPR